MKQRIKENFQKVVVWFQKLSRREKLLILVPSVLAILFVCYSLILTPVQEAFAKQKEDIKQAQINMEIADTTLKDYFRLKNRREEIEEQYKEIESKESGITVLEGLLRSKLELTPGTFKIVDGTPQAFGGSYEKTQFSVRFNSSDLGKLVAFLQELVHGKSPMILKRLDMKKRGDRAIDVDMDVSSIRRVK